MEAKVDWYWLIENDSILKNPYVSGIGNLPDLHIDDFGKIVRTEDQFWIRSESSKYDGDPDDLLQTHLSGYLAISKRFRDALESLSVSGIQYLPLRVFDHSRRQVGLFFIANLLKLVPALDKKKSDYDLLPADYFIPEMRGLISGIRKACLKKEYLNDLDIFRLADYPFMIFVSGRVKDIFIKNNFTGASFSKVECT